MRAKKTRAEKLVANGGYTKISSMLRQQYKFKIKMDLLDKENKHVKQT